MNTTTNYGLGKPLEDELYDIEIQNSNMDIIDTNLKSVSDIAYSASGGLSTHTANKSNPHVVTKSQVGLSNVPNVTTNNQTPTYTVPSALSALVSGEIMQTAFGKIAKAVNDLISHLANKSNPHSVTKSQVGLGSVDNTADSAKNVLSATKLTTARTISLGGELTGSASFNGTSNVSINASYTLGSTVNNRSGYVKFSNGLLLQWGNVSITPVPNEITSQAVTFAQEYAFVPVVIANGQTTGMGSTVKGVGASDITVSGFLANIVRENNYATTIIWIAIGFYQ
jgi:hypothetical protein